MNYSVRPSAKYYSLGLLGFFELIQALSDCYFVGWAIVLDYLIYFDQLVPRYINWVVGICCTIWLLGTYRSLSWHVFRNLRRF
jgi:hypothetical protein